MRLRSLALAVPALIFGIASVHAQQSPNSPNDEAVVETEQGSFTIRLRSDLAPAHVRHFTKTARAGGYDGTVFHRIVPGGIIQGGDPLSKDQSKSALYGTGGLGLLRAEFSAEPFSRSVVAAARRPSSPNSGGSQFFICLRDQPSLKGQYTIFGQVVAGMDVVDKLGETPVDGEKPRSRVVIQKVTIRDAAGPREP